MSGNASLHTYNLAFRRCQLETTGLQTPSHHIVVNISDLFEMNTSELYLSYISSIFFKESCFYGFIMVGLGGKCIHVNRDRHGPPLLGKISSRWRPWSSLTNVVGGASAKGTRRPLPGFTLGGFAAEMDAVRRRGSHYWEHDAAKERLVPMV